jgi:PAS domain S-box-containing protein
MTSKKLRPSEGIEDEVSALIKTLHETERRLEELTGGEVDTVSLGSGRPFLLRRAQEERRNSEVARQAAILDALPARVALLDPLGFILSVNNTWRRFSGDTAMPAPQFGVGLNYAETCDQVLGDHVQESQQIAAGVRAVLKGETSSFSFEYPSHLNTEQRWYLMTATPLAGDGIRGVVIMHLNITERKKVADDLLVSEKRFKTLFEQAAVGVAQTDVRTKRFVQVNQRFCEILGRSREELEQLTFPAVIHPQDRVRSLDLAHQIEAGPLRECTEEKRYLRKDGSEVWANVTVSAMWAAGDEPDYFIAVAQDVTGRKKLEEQLRQSQKMDAIGTLAGGIAHDFNNILAAINGYTELSRMKLTENPEVHGYLESVLQASGRATELVRQILTFSRRQKVERRPIQLQPIVTEAFKLLRASIPSTIEFEISLKDAPVVLADATQIHQMLMNLGTNAWHAMKDRPGMLQVKLERYVVDASHASLQARLHPGDYARLSVSDSGSGMDQETLKRIFEPFFTTKATGEGTGLGLAVVHGIMETHDGAVTVYSEPGEGTVFHLYFPAFAGAETVASDLGEVPRGHGERILFVDDEELLVKLGQKALTALGYEVEIATQPAAALALVRADPQRFALVLTDQTMPGMTGVDLARQLLQIRPGLPIILLTGYGLSLTSERVKAAGIRHLLLKPVTIHSLGSAVHAAISAPSYRI